MVREKRRSAIVGTRECMWSDSVGSKWRSACVGTRKFRQDGVEQNGAGCQRKVEECTDTLLQPPVLSLPVYVTHISTLAYSLAYWCACFQSLVPKCTPLLWSDHLHSPDLALF